MAEAEDVDERMEGNEQMAWMGAEDGDDSRQGRGGCARGNHGISEERNGSRGRGVPALYSIIITAMKKRINPAITHWKIGQSMI